MLRVARTCWPFKGARFLHPRPLPHRRQLPPPPRQGSHLNFNSPRTAGRRSSAGGGHCFARVGCATSGSARPVSPLHSRPLWIKSKRIQNAIQKSRPTPTVWLAPCLSPPPAAPSPASRARMPLAAPTLAKCSGNRYPTRPKDAGTRTAGGGKVPPSPPKSSRERSSSKCPLGPWESTSQ